MTDEFLRPRFQKVISVLGSVGVIIRIYGWIAPTQNWPMFASPGVYTGIFAGAIVLLLTALCTWAYSKYAALRSEWAARGEDIQTLKDRVEELETIVGDNLDQEKRLAEPLNQAVRRLYRSLYNTEYADLGQAEKDEVEGAFTKALAPLVEEQLSDRVRDQVNVHALLRSPTIDLTQTFEGDFSKHPDLTYKTYTKAPDWVIEKIRE